MKSQLLLTAEEHWVVIASTMNQKPDFPLGSGMAPALPGL